MNEEKKKPSVIKWLLSLIATVVLGAIVAYHFVPSLVEISASVCADTYCTVSTDSKTYGLFCMDVIPELNVYLDNNNDGFIRVEKISVRTNSFTSLSESDVMLNPDVGGMGDNEEPIYLISKVSCRANGVEECDYNYERGEYSPNDYIELDAHSGDKFFFNLEPSRSGIYEIQIEIDYVYNGKEGTITTEPCLFVYMNQSINDFYN